MTEIRNAVIDTLCRNERIEGEYAVQSSNRLYMNISTEYRSFPRNESNLYVKAMIARASAGAWSMYATMDVQDSETTVSIKRSKGIIDGKHDMLTFVFEHCNPEFPDNLLNFLRKGAIRAQRAFDLMVIKRDRRLNPNCRRRLLPRKAIQDRD